MTFKAHKGYWNFIYFPNGLNGLPHERLNLFSVPTETSSGYVWLSEIEPEALAGKNFQTFAVDAEEFSKEQAYVLANKRFGINKESNHE